MGPIFYTRARLMHEEGLALQRELGSRWGTAAALVNLATMYQAEGDRATANLHLREGFKILGELGDRRGMAEGLEEFASAAASADAGGKPDAYSLQIWAAASSLREASGSALGSQRTSELEANFASARNTLGEEQFVQAWERGRAMTAEEAIEFTLNE